MHQPQSHIWNAELTFSYFLGHFCLYSGFEYIRPTALLQGWELNQWWTWWSLRCNIISQNSVSSMAQTTWKYSCTCPFGGWAWRNVWQEYWGSTSLWPATSSQQVGLIFQWYEQMEQIHDYWDWTVNVCTFHNLFYLIHRWKTTTLQKTAGCLLKPHDRGAPALLSGHISCLHHCQPLPPEREVLNLPSLWCGKMLCLFCL